MSDNQTNTTKSVDNLEDEIRQEGIEFMQREVCGVDEVKKHLNSVYVSPLEKEIEKLKVAIDYMENQGNRERLCGSKLLDIDDTIKDNPFLVEVFKTLNGYKTENKEYERAKSELESKQTELIELEGQIKAAELQKEQKEIELKTITELFNEQNPEMARKLAQWKDDNKSLEEQLSLLDDELEAEEKKRLSNKEELSKLEAQEKELQQQLEYAQTKEEIKECDGNLKSIDDDQQKLQALIDKNLHGESFTGDEVKELKLLAAKYEGWSKE